MINLRVKDKKISSKQIIEPKQFEYFIDKLKGKKINFLSRKIRLIKLIKFNKVNKVNKVNKIINFTNQKIK